MAGAGTVPSAAAVSAAARDSAPPAPLLASARRSVDGPASRLPDAAASQVFAPQGSSLPLEAVAPPAPPIEGWTFGAYGETLLSTRFFHPDPKKTGSGYRESDIDFARLSFFVNSAITDWLSFSSEIELEHGGTGVAREIEWDEFGEYETEVEKGGEIALEQGYLEARLPWGFRLRAGILLVPVGITTTYHLPTMFATTHRSEAESHLMPMVWYETGAELQHRTKNLTLRLQAASGLDSTGFSSSQWIAGGTQKAFEAARFNDVGLALAADFTGVRGVLLGVSGYTSGATENRPKRELDDVNARVYLGDLHVRAQRGPLRLRAQALLGRLTHAAAITRANASLSNALGAPRTPVGSAAYAFYVEAAYDILAALRLETSNQLHLFARYETYDTMWRAPKALGNPLMQRQVVTTGINYLPHPRIVLKAEYLSRWINQGRSWLLRQDEVNASLGFVL